VTGYNRIPPEVVPDTWEPPQLMVTTTLNPRKDGILLFWLRKAFSHGVTDGGHPDLMGNAFSEKSFLSTLDVALRTARQLFLTKYSSVVNDVTSEEQIRICADCGVGAALWEAKSLS